MAKEKKAYKVLVDFEMGAKKFATGQEIELDPEKTATLLENGAIELLTLSADLQDQLSKKEPKESNEESSIIKQLMEEIKEMKATQDMLMQTTDKKLLAQYYANHQKKLPKEFRLNLFNGKVIILRRDMPVNSVGKNPATKQWFEDQQVEMVLEDDEVVKTTYQNSLTYTQEAARLIKSEIDEMTDEIICKVVRVSNGKEYNINLKYLN